MLQRKVTKLILVSHIPTKQYWAPKSLQKRKMLLEVISCKCVRNKLFSLGNYEEIFRENVIVQKKAKTQYIN